MRKLDTSWNHQKHVKNIKEAWINKVQEKTKVLGRFFDEEIDHIIDPSSIMLSTTWSDGRFENKAHPWVRSNLELQLITTIDHNPEKVDELISRIRDLVGFNIENIEHKKMWIDTLNLYNNKPELVFPTRFFDSIAFFDPSSIRSKLLEWISEEIIWNGKLTSKMYDRFRAHKVTMDTWEDKFHGKSYKSYDLDAWEFHYDPENFIYGVKNWPLRYVQYLLAVSLMRYIRDTKLHPWFLDILPTNIIDRLSFIRDNTLSSKSSIEIDRMQWIYEFFLHIYHEMQYRHFSEWATEFILEDQDALRDIRDMLNCLEKEYRVEHFYPIKK